MTARREAEAACPKGATKAADGVFFAGASNQPEKPVRILLCEDSPEGILSGVAAAYRSRYGHAFQKLALRDAQETMELFAEYREIPVDPEEARRVFDAVYHKIGWEAARWIDSAALSVFDDRAEAVYRFLIRGFAAGERTVTALGDPHVARMHEIDRAFSNEATHWQEFVRFRVVDEAVREENAVSLSSTGKEPWISAGASALPGGGTVPAASDADFATFLPKGGLLASIVAPKHRVIPRIMPFFADRFHGENFVIYDETHDMAGMHAKEQPWIICRDFRGTMPALHALLISENRAEREMQELWRIFFAATDIPERYNPKVQRGHLPIWKRKHMTEFAH